MKKAMHSPLTVVGAIAVVTMWSLPSHGVSVSATDNAFTQNGDPLQQEEVNRIRTAGTDRRVGYVRVPLSGAGQIGGIAAADITSASLDVYITQNGDGDTVRVYVLDDNAQYSVTNLTETTWTGGTDGSIVGGNNLTSLNMPHGPFFNQASNEFTTLLTEIGSRIYPGDGLDNNEDNLVANQVVQIAITDIAAFKAAISNDSNGEITLVIQSENIVDGSGTEFRPTFNNLGDPIPALTVLSGPDTTAPSTPTGLEVVQAKDATVNLKWNPTVEADVASVDLYRSTNSGSFVDPPVATLDYFAYTYTDTGVENGTTYYYAVSASDEVPNESALSAEVEATPEASPPPVESLYVEFGSNNEGFADFTTNTPATTNGIWTLEGDSVRYRNQDNGTLNGSLLREIVLDRSPGKRYRIEGLLTLTDGYADDNNRVGLYLFGDSPEVPNQFEVGAIGFIFNMDDGSGGNTNDNADDRIYLTTGIDGDNLSQFVDRNGEPVYAQELFGTDILLAAEITFFQECGGTNLLIQVDASLTANGTQTTVSLTTPVLAADYTGDYFGFVTRNRARNYTDGGPNTPETRSSPWVTDYRSFSIMENSLVLSIAESQGAPGDLDLSWNSKSGRRYNLWSSNSVAAPCSPLTLVETNIMGVPPMNTVTVSPSEPMLFFVVEEFRPPAPLSENFDAAAALPAGWVSSGPINGTDWEVGVPTDLLVAPPSASNCVGTVIAGPYTANVDVTLTTPSMAISAGASAVLSFRQYIDTDFIGDFGSVRVLDADNADAPIAGLEITGIEGIDDGWSTETLSLPAAAVGGKNIKIQFRFESDSSLEYKGFYIDDVSVTEQAPL